MTSALVNRKYKAAEVAPVAAKAMNPIRGISWNTHVNKKKKRFLDCQQITKYRSEKTYKTFGKF